MPTGGKVGFGLLKIFAEWSGCGGVSSSMLGEVKLVKLTSSRSTQQPEGLDAKVKINQLKGGCYGKDAKEFARSICR
jgi:hypothetical protein